MDAKQSKYWIVRAYTSTDKKHCFSSCVVVGKNRKEAKQNALNRNLISDSRFWTAGYGHILTIRRKPC